MIPVGVLSTRGKRIRTAAIGGIGVALIGALILVAPALYGSVTNGSAPNTTFLPAYTVTQCVNLQGTCDGATNILNTATGSGSTTGSSGAGLSFSLSTGKFSSKTTATAGPTTGFAFIRNHEWIKVDSYTATSTAAIGYSVGFVVTWSASVTVGACGGHTGNASGFMQVTSSLQDLNTGAYVGTSSEYVWQSGNVACGSTAYSNSAVNQFVLVQVTSSALTNTHVYAFQVTAVDSLYGTTTGPSVSMSQDYSSGSNGAIAMAVLCYNCP